MKTKARAGTEATRVLAALKALADEKRLRAVALLAGGEKCVCDLQAELDVRQSLLSFHLKALKEAGLVTDRREGRWVYYSLNRDVLQEVEDFLRGTRESTGPFDPGFRCCD
jgi:ArsR family transcriptional regulator, arsenate/arsenite/antimonite-responsive transcriptional repressor